MRMSQHKRTAVYRAIHEPLIDCRIALCKAGLSAKDDAVIAQVEQAIWRAVAKALDLDAEK